MQFCLVNPTPLLESFQVTKFVHRRWSPEEMTKSTNSIVLDMLTINETLTQSGTLTRNNFNKAFFSLTHLLLQFSTGENRRFDRCIVDWTNQCKSRLPLVAKAAFLQTATAAHISGPIYETFLCSGSLKPGSFGYLGQTALALIGPI